MPVGDRSVVPTPPYRGLYLVSPAVTHIPAPEPHAANLLYRATTIAAALFLLATTF